MIEDTDIGRMVLPNQQAVPTANIVVDKLTRRTGGNSQPENYHAKSRSMAGGYNKKAERNKQLNYSKREQYFTKNTKKTGYLETKNGRKSQEQQHDHESLQSLLNFHYSSPNATRHSYSGYGGVKRKRTSTFNKEAFLQANCQFVVDEDPTRYDIHAVDPDVLVDWRNIQLVYLSSHDAPTCPICLYPPTCGKITKCGHVFCWSCILHYLHLGEKQQRKCPICNEHVHQDDLKSVITHKQKKFARLDMITMKLMRRSKDSVFALPSNEWKPIQFPVWTDPSFHSGYKLAMASPQAILDSILLREQVELEVQLSEAALDKSGEECFIQLAMEELKNRIAGAARYVESAFKCSNQLTIEQNVESYHVSPIYSSCVADMLAAVDVNEEQAFSDYESIETTSSLASPTIQRDIKKLKHICTEEEELEEKTYQRNRSSNSSGSSHSFNEDLLEHFRDEGCSYFYQAEDDQNIFIHPLNYRCLIEEYGSLGEGPLKICGQIIDFECFTMTKDLRKRFRHLAHLPVACEFIVCELILKPPVLSKHTIHNFMAEFRKRKEARSRKIEEQRRFDRRTTAVRNKQEGYHVPSYYEEPVVHLNLEDVNDFPCSISPDTGENQVLKDAQNDHAPIGPSFAQMLKTEGVSAVSKVKPSCWQVTDSVNQTTERRIDVDSEDEVIAPSFKEMFSAAMYTTPVDAVPRSIKSKKKNGGKSRSKGTLLFATGGQRKY